MTAEGEQIPGARTYLVGGAVRDGLLGLPVRERDFVVVGSDVATMIDQGFTQVGKDFPVFLHPETKEEYALARTERKSAPGYHGFVVHADPLVTLEEDLARRDLTINALAQDAEGRIIDPFGGQADLHARLLRHVSPAFAEDPVRILRVARFAARFDALGFGTAPETAALMREMVAAGEVDALVPDRVWQELSRALGEARPSRFFEELRHCGALKILLPELERLWGVPQPEQWHPEVDTGVHVMMVLDQCARLSDEPEVRFAALCHDLGKGTTPGDVLPSHHGHEERSVELLGQVCQRLPVPTRFSELARVVARYHGKVHKVDELRASTILGVFEGADLFRRPERFERLLIACEADFRGRLGFEDRDYPQGATWRRLAQACAAVDSGAIARASEPTRIRESVRLARLEAVKAALGAD
ncbi:multifunctional CCA addition/repair protein [Thiorhodovibrio frisius]|uniref:Multifunctional CCA protein n=1 Tax=Thiorhodovibrio frisius TaxID=631362 RepID=H8Z4X9_9GAMM|nr:multifunctional CCA addition/repair protein [Thiorhodovibrio frisius]EIC20386.1 tRNA nucleotidyltransferase/poly(A) polymerase [Thiorhodovibrio frisius]WPL21128.1 Multifunctional CCA protein [Thiorhodovibrio frisius]